MIKFPLHYARGLGIVLLISLDVSAVPFGSFGAGLGRLTKKIENFLHTHVHHGTVLRQLSTQYERVCLLSPPELLTIRGEKLALRVPAHIHHIWLGSVLPARYHAWVASWKQYHPGWEHTVWDDAQVLNLLTEYEQDFPGLCAYYHTLSNYGARSDLARLVILYLLGGLYVDIDFQCIRSFDDLNARYSFYAGLLPITTQNGVLVANGLIGAAPGHIIIRRCLEDILAHPELGKEGRVAQILDNTGPGPLTRAVYTSLIDPEFSRLCADSIVFPTIVFYPPDIKKGNFSEHTYAIHHWAGSWTKPAARIKK